MFKTKIFTVIIFITTITTFIQNTIAKNIPTKFNPNNPIEIQSNEIVIKKNKKLIIFTGKVEAIQEKMKIFANKMQVIYETDEQNKIKIQYIKLNGNVILKNETITIKGDKGFYNLNTNIITLEDNIIMNENDAVIFGQKVVYNTITEETNIFGENKEDKNNKKRITIILDNINELKERYDN